MSLQNSSGVGVLVSLQECQEREFFQHITVLFTTCRKAKISLARMPEFHQTMVHYSVVKITN